MTPTVAGAPFSFTASGAGGDYIFDVHGVGNDPSTITHDAGVILRIVDFGLTSPSPGSLTANRPATSNATTFQVTATGSFNQAVNLSCSGLPTGAACNFSPSASVSPTAGNPVSVALTISTSATTPTGLSTVTISANTTGSPAPKTQSLTLTVTALPDYVLDIPNKSQSALVAAQATFNGTLTAINGYSTAVTVTCGTGQTAPPPCTFSPPSPIVPAAGGTPFSVTVSSPTTRNYSFNINGNGPGALNISQSVPVTFSVTSDFSLPTNSGTATIPAGGTAQYTLNFAPVGDNTFLNAVTYSCSTAGFPNLSRCTFNPTQISQGAPATDVTLSISTTAPIASLSHRDLFYAFWISIPVLALVLAGAGLKRKPARATALCIVFGLALVATVLQSACGGGGSAGTTPPPQPGTTPGAYTITINASETSGATTVQHSTTVNLTVQ